jgi:hypothetical protein
MKATPLLPPGVMRRAVVSLLSLYPLSFSVLFAALPTPSCVFYGEVRDEYGVPYVENAEVILRVAGRECNRWPIVGILAPGVNFKLMLEMDEGTGALYATYAARAGQSVSLSVLTQGGERPIVETHALAVGQPGEFIGVYVNTGSDTDGDGLPDEWEQLLVDNSSGGLSDISQVQPEDDFDGDGVSNLDEYRGGTYAFLGDDFLAVEEMASLVGGRLRLRFLTTRGITYQVLAAKQIGEGTEWQTQRFSLGESDASAPHDALVGDGYYVSVYVPVTDPSQFYRLVAQ